MQADKKAARELIVLNAAYALYTKNKIENVTMKDVAEYAGVGTTTIFRNYRTKLELASRVCAYKWKEYLVGKFAERTPEFLEHVDAIDRIAFTLDLYIDLYRNHKDFLLFNDNFNHFLHENKNEDKLDEYFDVFKSFSDRFNGIYERAKIDHTMRTDLPEGEIQRILLHSMMGTCVHYARGFSWGAKDNEDYDHELIKLREILLNWAREGCNE